MLSTEKLFDLADLADLKGWRLALVGDPMQFSAVNRGGMFGQLVDTFGAIELGRVHRFANEWEREASLELRRGESSVAEVYDQHGRLHGGTASRMERDAVHRWWQHRQADDRTLLMAPSNEAVERLNQRAQQIRIVAGEIDTRGTRVTAGSYELHVGDEIATRPARNWALMARRPTSRTRRPWRRWRRTSAAVSGTVMCCSTMLASHPLG